MLKASVVMATNSTVDSIADAVSALTAQTYGNLEIVIVIDRVCAPDEKALFQSTYPEVNFQFLDSVNFLPAALNAGIAAASGEIILRCDDDDICVPQRVTRQVELLQSGDLDFVWSTALGVRDGGGTPWTIPCPQDDASIKSALVRRNVLVHSTLAGWKSSFERVGMYSTTFKRSQDYEMYLRALRKGMKFGAVKEPLVTRHYGRDSITVKHRKNQIMFSFAAQILHGANTNDIGYVLRRSVYYIVLLLFPDSLRSLRRRISTLTRRGV